MGSKRHEENYEEAEYSDDFEPYDDGDLDDDSCDEIRVYKSSKGPTLTIQPRKKKPCSPFRSDSEGELNKRKVQNKGSSMMGVSKIPQPMRPKGPSEAPAKSSKAMLVSPPYEEEVIEFSNDGSSEMSPRNEDDVYTNRQPFKDSQIKSLAKANITASYQSLSVRIGGFRNTVGSTMSTNATRSSNNIRKVKPYTPVPPPMRCGMGKGKGTVTQRLLSAKRMTINDLRNKLKELQIEMGDLKKENSTLKHVEHRHQLALRKLEGREAELPRLMDQHRDELKNAHTHVKKLSVQCRDFEIKLKQRDKKIVNMELELQKLRHLCSETELDERQNLQTQLDIVSANLCGAEKRLIQHKRHIEILEKNHRHQIHVEKQKLIRGNNHSMELQNEIHSLRQALRDKDRVLNYVQMRGSGRKLIRSFHEDERVKTSKHTLLAGYSQFQE